MVMKFEINVVKSEIVTFVTTIGLLLQVMYQNFTFLLSRLLDRELSMLVIPLQCTITIWRGPAMPVSSLTLTELPESLPA
jgi:hypothetical protein